MITATVVTLVFFAMAQLASKLRPHDVFLCAWCLACAYALASKVLWPEYLP